MYLEELNLRLPKKPTVMALLLGIKLETIHNDKIYYIQENEDEEEWELFAQEIK